MTRRANGEASIVTLKDGSWRAAFRFDREDGTTGRKYLRATTQTDARSPAGPPKARSTTPLITTRPPATGTTTRSCVRGSHVGLGTGHRATMPAAWSAISSTSARRRSARCSNRSPMPP